MSEFLTDSIFFGAIICLVSYEIGLILKRKFRLALLNPLLIGTVCVLSLIHI